MKKLVSLNVLVNAIIVLVAIFAGFSFVSCDNEKVEGEAVQHSDTIRVLKGYKYETSLTHTWDSVYKIKVTDAMVSGLKIWRTEGGQKIEPALYDNSERPLMEAHSELAKEDYAITESQVNIKPTSSTLLRNQKVEKDGSTTELDTLRFWFEDGQILSVPVTITNKLVKLGDGSVFDFASLTLVKGEFAHLINHPKNDARTRGAAKTYVSAEYNTEYKTWLTLKETNIENPKTFVVPVYAYTDRRVLSDDAIDKIIVENQNRVWLDTLTERCSFDRVTVYKSGDRTSETKEIVLKHLFKGIEPYDKFVSNFDYSFTGSNGIAGGSEASRESGVENWSVWGKTDKYSANVENGVSADKIVTDYSLYHERCIYKDDSITVEFPYVAPEVQEIQTVIASATSDKAQYKKAQVKNFIGTSYLGGNQGLNELVNLYMASKDIIGYDIINPKIVVLKDSVVADLDFVTKYEDGTEIKVHDHFNGPRSLKCNTNWESIQEILSQLTDTTAVVNMSGSEGKQQGYWRYANETRNISTYAHLYNGEAKLNGWTSVVPNKISYVREGKSYSFDVLPYSVKEQGAALNLRGKEGGFTVYDYTDLIEENYGGYIQNSTAPGVLKIADDVITGYEIRNKLLTITPENVTASLDFVTIFSNGHEDVEKVSKDFPRSLVCTTDWKASEKNAEQTTAQPNATVSASQNMTDDEWSWVNQTRSISATVTLNGSTQYNGWTAVDPNNIKFTRNGVTADFGTIAHKTAKVVDNVTLSSTEGLTETYKYDNTISVSYGDNMQNTTAPGTITVNKDKEVTGHEFRNKSLVITKSDVTASLTYVTKYNDGSEDTESVSKSFPRTLNCYTNWTVNESNASVLTSDANVMLKGRENMTDGNWKYNNETRNITTTAQLQSSNQTNGWNAMDPNNIKYTRDGETCDFGTINFAAEEAGHHVEVVDDTATLTTYSYSDDVTVTFGDNVQTISAPGTINVGKAKTIVGYEIRNKLLTISNENVSAVCDFVTLWSDGSEDSERVAKDFPRSLVCTTDWKATEKNAEQTTAQPNATVSASQNMTDDEWSWVNQTRSISATVTLNGSTQYNGWTAVDPNNIKFTRNGVTADFGTIAHKTAKVVDNVTLSSTEGLTETYKYDNTISVSYGDNMQNTTAPGTITVNKDKEVTGHEFRNKSLVITKSDVTASLTYVTKYNDGSEDTESVSKSFPRTLNCYTNWTVNESNASVLTSDASVSLKSSESKKDGDWSYTAEKRDITTTAQLQNSNQINGWNALDPNNIKYTRDGETCDFGAINFSAAESGQTVNVTSDTATLTTYSYSDDVTITFGDNVQTISAPGTINVAKAKTIVGYEITNQTLTVNQNDVTASLTFITKWSDGSEDSENISKVFARNFQVLTNWSSEEDNANQSTGSASVTLKNTENKTDGDWSYARETRGISTTATLNGSSQNNGWESIDPNNIVFSRNGKTHDFGAISFSANETGASVNKKSETSELTVYDYTDNISVSFGSNSFASSAPGQIKVAAPWNPDFDHGKFTGCVFTTARNEQRNTWVYIASIHFEKGTLPVVIRQDASKPEVNEAYFETNTDSRLNSGTWIPSWGKWINTIATDSPDLMQWDTTEGANADNMAYPTATAWGWDYGYTVSGHPSVTTDKFSASISNDGYVLTIYKGSNVFATYKAAKH